MSDSLPGLESRRVDERRMEVLPCPVPHFTTGGGDIWYSSVRNAYLLL